MNYHKKIISAIMSILLCISSTAVQAYAENEEENSNDEVMAISLDDGEAVEEAETTTKDSNEIISGDFTYIVDDDGFAHIASYIGENTDVTIPEELDGIKVTEINSGSFLSGVAETIHIPANIEYISADNPFAPCLKLSEITVAEESEYYCSVDGVLFSKDMKKLMCYPPKKKGESYTIPEGVEKLGVAAIEETHLFEIILPDSLKELSRHSLSFNYNLSKIDMSNTSVEAIPFMCFVMCQSLKDVRFSAQTKDIGTAAFMNCSSLKEITLPDGMDTIEQNAFMGTAMKEVRIPESVSRIGYCAFGYYDENTKDEGFTIIGRQGSAAQTYANDRDDEYDYENNFTFITTEVADSEEEYKAMNPQTSSDGEYEYSVIDDNSCCILFCVAMDETINIPEEIGGYKVTSIYKGAFLTNEAKNLIFPDTVEKIGEAVFSEYVESITISANCKEIEGSEPFISCKNLKEINVNEGGDGEYSSMDGVLYNKDKSMLILYPIMKEDKTFRVPSGVKEIEMSAFCYNEFIEEVDLTGVETINSYAFEGCKNIKNVTFSDSLNFVGNDVFIENTSLMSVRIPSSVETIGDYAFGYYYDESVAKNILQEGSTEETVPFSVISGFKIYADEDSLAWKYAKACGIEVVANTTEIGGKNVDKNFIYVICGIAGAAVLAVIGVITGKSIKNKKKRKKS